MISQEPRQNTADVNPKPIADRSPHYAPPKLEKMQQLAQVTGGTMVTGAVAG